MANKIWIVYGERGEYSDHQEWSICFYYSEDEAKKHVELATARHREIKQLMIEKEKEFELCGCCYVWPNTYCEKHNHIKNEFDTKGDPDAYSYADTVFSC